MPDQSEKMLKLRPVTFTYKHDDAQAMQYGLIAEEVNELYPEIVVHKDGKVYTVNYMALIPLLVKQIQEMEKQLQEQESYNRAQDLRIEEQDMAYEQLLAEVKELRALVNKLMVLMTGVIN